MSRCEGRGTRHTGTRSAVFRNLMKRPMEFASQKITEADRSCKWVAKLCFEAVRSGVGSLVGRGLPRLLKLRRLMKLSPSARSDTLVPGITDLRRPPDVVGRVGRPAHPGKRLAAVVVRATLAGKTMRIPPVQQAA